MPRPSDAPGAMPLFRIRVVPAHPQQGERSHAVEILTGDVAQADGRAKRLTRIVDRRGDRYREFVRDPHTGELLHMTDEPLSKHRDHGGAKRT